MMKGVADTARLPTELLLPIMRYRMASLGVEGFRAHNFYRSRRATSRVFGDYEVWLAERIVERLASIRQIHEIGCGWDQLVLLLAWCGYEVTGFEVDNRRFLGAEGLRRVIAQIDKGCTAFASLRNEFFPPLEHPGCDDTPMIATSVVVSNPGLVEDQMLWALRRSRYAIVDVDRFCCERQLHERSDFAAQAEQIGLKSAGLICDAGSSGQCCLFERYSSGNDIRRGRACSTMRTGAH